MQEETNSSNYILLSNSIESNIVIINPIIVLNSSSIDYELLNLYKKARLNSSFFNFFNNLSNNINKPVDSKNLEKLKQIKNIWIIFRQSITNDITQYISTSTANIILN